MLATVLLLSLIAVAFWRSLIRLVLAALLVLLVAGGIQAAQLIGAVVTVSPQPPASCAPADQNHC
jgi:hypothetical protein